MHGDEYIYNCVGKPQEKRPSGIYSRRCVGNINDIGFQKSNGRQYFSSLHIDNRIPFTT
jgi:hypothetical protein